MVEKRVEIHFVIVDFETMVSLFLMDLVQALFVAFSTWTRSVRNRETMVKKATQKIEFLNRGFPIPD